ncbi:MAG: hypothetical protein Q9216_000754 [Gyalolechia sp. 2 TL-2023]
MTIDAGQRGEEQQLGSWHPAHMPSSDGASDIDKQLPRNVAADSLPGHSSPISSTNIGQAKLPSSDGGGEVKPCTEPLRPETTHELEVSPQLYSNQSTGDDGDQWENSTADERGNDREPLDSEQNHEEQNTGLVNGLSFVRPLLLQPDGLDSSQSIKAGQSNGNGTNIEQSNQDLDIRNSGQISLSDLGTFDRADSFPAVPPLHQVREVQHKARVQSQVGNIIEEDEEIGDRAEKSFHAGNLQQNDTTGLAEGILYGDSSDRGEDAFLGRSVGVDTANHSLSPADDEARFEEGLPLMQSESSTNEVKDLPMRQQSSERSPSSTRSASKQDILGEEADSGEEASFFQPKQLDRKTTSQVLDGLSYSPRSTTRDEPSPQESRFSMESVSGGGIALSSSTLVSQVVAERSQSTENSLVEDEDLAAMWQAALDDDDLLDDTDLTAGQSAVSTAMSPAIAEQSSQSPFLQPVYSAEETMRGFDSAQSDGSAFQGDRYSPAPNQQNKASSFYSNPDSITGQQSQVPSIPNLGHSSSSPSGFGQPVVQRPSQGNGFAPIRPSMPKPAQSFSDKSKGGYTSPYDLPMDVTRPKKRTNLQQVQNVSSSRTPTQPPPPPRSSSMYARGSGSLSDGPSPPVPPTSSAGAGPPLPGSTPVSSNIKDKPSVGSFFTELPATKSRPSSSAGRYAPATPSQTSSQLPPRPEPPRQMPSTQQLSTNTSNATSSYQLVPPERQSPYAALPQQDTLQNPPQQISSRYSPALGLQSHVPPPRNRYAASPAKGSRPPPSTNTMPFQPRTSSPLAQTSTDAQQQHRDRPVPNDASGRSLSPHKNPITQNINAPHHHAVSPLEELYESSVGYNVPGASTATSPPGPRSIQDSFHLRSQRSTGALRNPPAQSGTLNVAPDSETSLASPSESPQHPSYPLPRSQGSAEDLMMGPPRRSQTQSPGTTRHGPEAFKRMKDVHQPPTSATSPSPVRAEPPISSSHAPLLQSTNSPSHGLIYIRPTDGREHDPLERWKGAPILTFGFGGIVATSFPKRIPRYTAGHGFPMMKCSPGEMKLQTTNIGTLDDNFARFPGPLKSKGKKKELLEWLQLKIDALEKAQPSIVPNSSLPDPVEKHEEKILLWKIVRILVEGDGIITGNSRAESSIRAILCPTFIHSEHEEPSAGGPSAGVSRSEGSHSTLDMVSPGTMEMVRRLLLQGERAKAVWHAVDQRMWAHAMLLSSTLDKSIWKQVLHEFTRLEVKTFGENTESLAALYEVFAGNWDESIDQLVPPSARAGLQMVSKVASTGPTRNALDGLDKWRETLTLILSNRTHDDENALVALGRLLAGYGRTEAAHLCLVFAKAAGLFGGMEDCQASIALLGADHQQQPYDYGRDLDSILLTEVYEFARSVLTPSASLLVSPHLQSYKLYHAMLLAEHGYRSEAQQYCDAIMGTLKSTTKPSPYYHSLLFNALDDLVERLQQAPRDTSSWMSKPMDKVSGSMWKKFNSFIVGDENDAASAASGRGEQDHGPFARVATDTPSISRNGSSMDLYNTMTSQAVPPLPADTAFGSRYAPSNPYAPSGQYTPRSSLEQQARPSEEYQRPGQPSTLRPSQPQHSYLPNQSRYTASPAPQHDPSVQQQKPRYQPSPYISPKPDTFLPTPPSQPEYIPIAPPDGPASSFYPQEFYQSDEPSEIQASQVSDFHDDSRPNGSCEPPLSTYEPGTSAYEPPLSFVPYNPDGQEDRSPDDQRSPTKKRSFVDDDEDDDFAARAAAILKGDKARKDKEADEAFRKAAEADSQNDEKDLKPKKSWFGGVGGWLGGKKDDNLSSQEPKAIKAKLGEENSFYYDKELKKWVNKKGPVPATTEAPRAPPPRGPPSRAVSAAGGQPPSSMSNPGTPPMPPLPSTLLSSSGTPPINVSQPSPSMNPDSGPPSRMGTPAGIASPAPPAAAMGGERVPSAGPPSAPPSRPPTATSGAGSIDDLIGEPQARKGGTVRRGKKGRGYVDVMAK